MRRQILTFLAVFAIAVPGFAQSNGKFNLGSGTIDLAVPESPAFAALGLTPQEVTRPSTGRELATTLLNGVDRDGNFQTGVSIETAPYMLLAGSHITLQQYQKGQYVTRLLARLQASFAIAKGSSSEDKAAKIAIGARFTIFDYGDPRMDSELLQCLEGKADVKFKDWPPVPPTADAEAVNLLREEAIRAATKGCRTKSAQRRWNRSAWIAGVAPTWTSPDGAAGTMDYSGTALWSSIGYGFEGIPVMSEHALLAGYFKVRNQEIVADRFHEGQTIEQDSLAVGGRLLFGSTATQFTGEALWIRNRRADDLDDRYWRVSLGFEQRLIDNTWLDVSFGRELNREADNSYHVMGSLKWGLGARSQP